MENIDSFDHVLNVHKLNHMLSEMKGNKDLTPYQKWLVKDGISWAVGFMKEYGLIGTDEEVILWPSKMPDDLEFSNHQLLRFKDIDWQPHGIFDWLSAYQILRSAMFDHDDMLSYSNQYALRDQVKAMLDLIVKQPKEKCL